MYGYVVVNKPELKIKEYDLYLAYYCGLCHTLKDRYGNISRLTLSYDMTFLVILLSSLYEYDEVIEEKKCLKKLGQKRKIIMNQASEYVADMSIILSYLKCEDDYLDEKKYKQKVMQLLLSKDMDQVKKQYPDKVTAICEALDALHIEEKKQNMNIDEMAGFFGKVFGIIFSYQNDMWKNELYDLGYYLGEYIYLLDAYDDLEEDLKKNLYNPFSDKYQLEHYRYLVKDALETVISVGCNSFEMLPILKNIDLLRNILYSGIWTKFDNKQLVKESE